MRVGHAVRRGVAIDASDSSCRGARAPWWSVVVLIVVGTSSSGSATGTTDSGDDHRVDAGRRATATATGAVRRRPAARRHARARRRAGDDAGVRGPAVPVLPAVERRHAAHRGQRVRPHREDEARLPRHRDHRPELGRWACGPIFAAGEQNKLWNMSDALYAKQGEENSGWITTRRSRALRRRPGRTPARLLAASSD